jgi:hypothetical protein
MVEDPTVTWSRRRVRRVCPAHREPLNDELVCDLCIYPRTSWLVVNEAGQVLAAGRVEHRNLRDPATPAVLLTAAIDELHSILQTLAHHPDQNARQEREVMAMPWGNR